MKNQKENKEKPVIVLSFDGTVMDTELPLLQRIVNCLPVIIRMNYSQKKFSLQH